MTGIDVVGRRVIVAGTMPGDGADAIEYDHLIVAAGTTNSYFGHSEWARHAPGLKTLADAFVIRARVIGPRESGPEATGRTRLGEAK